MEKSYRLWISSLLLSLLVTHPNCIAQDYNKIKKVIGEKGYRIISIGYSSREFEYDYDPSSDYSYELQTLRKGYIEVDYEEYFKHSFYLNISSNYLFSNQWADVLGGPINFNETGMSLSLGFRYHYLSLFGGVYVVVWVDRTAI